MSKKKLIKRFCETCRKRTIFNKTRNEGLIVCSRCGRSRPEKEFQQTFYRNPIVETFK